MSDPIDREWPTVVFAKDEDEPEERFARITVLSMGELARRLQRLGARVAASLNRLPFIDRPLLALEATAGPALPDQFWDLDVRTHTFTQGGLVWVSEQGDRADQDANVYALTQTLESPGWRGDDDFYDLPGLAIAGRQFFVLALPRQIDPSLDLRLHVGKYNTAHVDIPADLVAHPPHPLLWWGTPPASFET